MSGWIKLEKDLREDPRFLRMLALLRNQELSGVTDVTQVRITERRCVTLLLGSLAQLWMYADSYLREDDTLDLGANEVDQLVGIDGFCDMMPEDWLQVLDEHSVKLPRFHEFNGTDAKKKALTAKRVARHRIRNVTQERCADAPTSNAGALPDQTRPDQTRPRKKVPSEPLSTSSTDEPPDHASVPRETSDRIGESVARVFRHWREVHGHDRAQLDAKRRRLIRAALENYSEADLCMAISGYRNSPHHMGQNDRGTVYDDIGLMLRDASHIDAGLRFNAEPPRTDLSAQTRRIIDQTEGWVPPEVRRAAN